LRMAGVQRTRDLAWLTPLGGAALMMTADLLSRILASPIELPVGAVMALIGAPVFIYYLARGAR
jgi:iron complex transport system permease protein